MSDDSGMSQETVVKSNSNGLLRKILILVALIIVGILVVVVIIVVAVTVSSKSSDSETSDSETPVETKQATDGIITVSVMSNGLRITKAHDSKFVHVTIFVVRPDESRSENVRISANETVNSFLYPFVQSGKNYTIYATMMDSNWGSWTKTENVTVEAFGGLGDFYLTYSEYSYNNKTYSVTFSNYHRTEPR